VTILGHYGASVLTRTQCYTELVLRNLTITVSEEAALWARRQAAEKNTSVSKMVGQMLEEQMRRTDSYRSAYRKWKKIAPVAGADASRRLTRDELYERRR
jgi:hypothetical protein